MCIKMVSLLAVSRENYHIKIRKISLKMAINSSENLSFQERKCTNIHKVHFHNIMLYSIFLIAYI